MIGRKKKAEKAERPRSPREELMEMLKRQREEALKFRPEEKVRIPEPPPERWRPKTVPLERVMRELGVEPLYPELYDMAVKTCRDWQRCYAMFIDVWETPHKWLLFEAAMAGLDTEHVAKLILEGRIDEAKKLVEP
ncbi:hypothetical protein [Pyrobaculum ferrireducens]|uniref:Uncharacterized protein n=1 Tax=Pyrobaculum ferrireducens TaxID=1104324 RepID=G7VG84_9CREN|nr:hypothetical protein [Pyrobaculum ferrireducens]AET34283.1 hypothetical protein P186_2907 [Pyrobaculum ferrireducens]